MPYKTCQHVMEHGQFCQSPALRKKDYCYFHIEFRARRLKMARARARGERWWLDLPCIEDLRSCQAASARVFEASAAQLIDQDHARFLFSMLRMMASNFKARKAWDIFSDFQPNPGLAHVGGYAGFETVHDLPEDIDLDEDPLKLFPMPEVQEAQEPAGAPLNPSVGLSGIDTKNDYPSGAPFKPSSGLSANDNVQPPLDPWEQVTAGDMELNEILQREGEQAMLKRAKELERNQRRRELRLQRARYEEMARQRNLQLAAQKMLRQQQRADAAKAGNAAPEQAPTTSVAQTIDELTTDKKPPASASEGSASRASDALAAGGGAK